MRAARWGMSCYVRPKVTGARVFFTVGLARRGSRLLVDEVDRLRKAVRVTREERPFEMDAFVVLPDHIHAVWTMPRGDREYGKRWAAIKARFTRSLPADRRVGFYPTIATRSEHAVGWNPTLHRTESKVRKGDGGIWQRRFWEHHIRDEADYWMHVRYCWMNPVKHGLVARPEDWPYSSVHWDARFKAGMEMEV